MTNNHLINLDFTIHILKTYLNTHNLNNIWRVMIFLNVYFLIYDFISFSHNKHSNHSIVHIIIYTIKCILKILLLYLERENTCEWGER